MEWINVKDKLPTNDGIYYVCFESTELFSRSCGREWFLNGEWVQEPMGFHLDIIYWMPLPTPPKE